MTNLTKPAAKVKRFRSRFGYTRDKQPTAKELAAMPVHLRWPALLEATAKFYHDDNRATIKKDFGTVCVYRRTKNRPGCAIGRWLKAAAAKSLGQDLRVTDAAVYPKLPPWMQEIGISYLSNLQDLHDSDEHWTAKGLTKKGREQVTNMR